MLSQLEELLTWYGPIDELWFDGGVLRAELGGPDIPALLARVAPDIICFGGPPGVKNLLRWSWNESGVAPPECYSTAHFTPGGNPVNITCDSPGDPNDPIWAPSELFDIEYVEIQEDQSEGQNILGWEIELPWPKRWSERWITYEKGCSVGHKRIIRTGSIRTPAIRFRITDSRGNPVVRLVRVFGRKAYPDENR